MLLVVTVALPIYVVGSIVYRVLANWKAGTPLRVLLSAVVALAWWSAAGAVWPSGPLWLRRTLGFSAAFVIVASVAFVALRFSWARLMYRWRVLVSMLVGVTVVAAVEARTIDGFDGTVSLLILGDHTQYAPSYSDSGWRRIRTGMTPIEVEGILGRPLDEWTVPDDKGRVYRRWARSRDGSDNFRVRVVTFLGGRVSEKSAYIFPD
jgi:hypothetical protein